MDNLFDWHRSMPCSEGNWIDVAGVRASVAQDIEEYQNERLERRIITARPAALSYVDIHMYIAIILLSCIKHAI